MEITEETRLPEGWLKVGLGEIVTFEYGKGLTKENRDSSGNVPVYGSNGIVGYHSDSLIKKSSLIIGRKGAAGCVHLSKVPSWPIDTTYYLIPPDAVELFYLYHLLSTLNLNSLDKSTAIPGLNRNDAYAIEIPLPPLPEQNRIVTRIEELFTNLDAGVVALKKSQTQLKRYRQSVLKSAFMGQLVHTEAELARADGRDYESAEVLLERILEERRRKWKESNKKRKYKEPNTLDSSGMPELPEGWSWTMVGNVSLIIMGQSPPGVSYNTEGVGIPLINGPVEFGAGSFSKTIKAKFTTSPNKMCQENDLILCVRGSTTGRMNIAGFDACIGRGVASIRSFIEQWYINYYVHFNEKNIFNMGTGSTFPNISSNQISEFYLPLPPLAEQHHIVAEVERRFSVVDEIENTISSSLKQAERLRQSILKQAFEGKLVPQDPNDEPASVLLERIKEDKAKRDAEEKAKKKVKGKTTLKKIKLV